MSSDDSDMTRRRILLGLGTGAAVGLAGCSGNGGGGDTATATEEPTDTSTEEPTETPTEEPTETSTEEPTEEPAENASVRVAHMSPDAPNVDVYVDGSVALEDVAFNVVSDYLEVPAGERELEITAAGDPDSSVFAGAVTFEPETNYTVAAIGEVGDMAEKSFEPLILEDNNSNPGSDTARVRAVHVSPDAPAVDITVASSGNALFDGVSYSESDSTEVPTGDYTLEVRGDTESNDGDIVGEFDVSLAGGQVYTAFAAGYLESGGMGGPEFDLIVSQDTSGMN